MLKSICKGFGTTMFVASRVAIIVGGALFIYGTAVTLKERFIPGDHSDMDEAELEAELEV